MRRSGLFLVAAVATVGAACGGRWLTWKSRPAAPAVAGKIMITVTDRREEKKGGQDPRVVANERNGWGIPFAIRLRTNEEAAESLRDMLGQAALTAGIGVAPVGDNMATARVAVEIQNMWCDGYSMVYKANLTASVMVLGPDNQPRMAAMPLTAEDGHMNCRSAYQKMLTKAYDQAVAMMSMPQFKEAAMGGGAAPPPPPPPAPPPAPEGQEAPQQ